VWNFLVRQILRQALKRGAKQELGLGIGGDPLNEDEAYVDRMKRDFHIDDYYKALELYNSDPSYWRQYYRPLPSPDPAHERIRDSAAMAGVPSRYNVWEYGYPDETTNSVIPQSPSNNPAPPTGKKSESSGSAEPTARAATDASDAPMSLFSYLMSTGNFNGAVPTSPANAAPSGPPSFQTASALRPSTTRDASDTGQPRFLLGRTYDPSQGSPLAAPPVSSQPSPDGSLSLNDAYLEYLKRLNAI
jgi:hypothetical protein